MTVPEGDAEVAEFRSGDSELDAASWIDHYVQVMGWAKPELNVHEAGELARAAFAREGVWTNPRIAALADAVCGPLLVV